MSHRYLAILVAGSLSMIACSQSPEPPASTPAPAPEASSTSAPSAPSADSGMPASIVAERGAFIPEGIEYDKANGRFLTGSLAEGTIFEIDGDGTMTPFVEDPELVSSVGIEVDEPRDRLLVANSDRAVFDGQAAGQAKLGVFSLTTGERIAMVDLAGVLQNPGDDPHYFANDVAVADDGTVFVTDTQQNVVYAVDTDYRASVLHRFEPMEGLALNGIEYHPGGYLIVVGGANLYKMPIDNPDSTAQIELPEPMTGADGIVWAGNDRLAVVSNSQSRVVMLTSIDDWASAEIDAVAMFDGQATTAAVAGGDVYVVQPHFNDQDPPRILRVSFR